MNKVFALNFAPGFEETVRNILDESNLDLVILESGFCIVRSEPNFDVTKLKFASSIYEVYDFGNDLQSLDLSKLSSYRSEGDRTFNLRYFEEGAPAKLNDDFRREFVREIADIIKLKYSAFNPDRDFVLVKRASGINFFGVKLKGAPKKDVAGRLGYDVTYLIEFFCGLKQNKVVLDAFGGYGGLSEALLDSFLPKSLIIVEKDSRLVNGLKRQFSEYENCKVVAGDVIKYLRNGDGKFDLIISDPPWGEYDSDVDIDHLYTSFLGEAKLKLSNGGVILILSSAKNALDNAVHKSGLTTLNRANVLISGKKVLVLKLGNNG